MQLYHEDANATREELLSGLLAPRASTSPKFLYDALGSKLFEAITELDEYYPTRVEATIFAAHAAAMAERIGRIDTLVDLGAGNCAKASRVLQWLRPQRYVAVDISVAFLRDALRQVQRTHPSLDIVGLGMDFSATLHLPADAVTGRPLYFYPGSSLGNFTPAQALGFLRELRTRAEGGGLLVGIDLVKPAAVLDAAYDDALGVTAAFDLNLLRHLNRVVGADFDPRQWRHIGRYNAAESRVEMHLEAREALTVHWPGGERRFAAGEHIHTENSYKYTPGAFADLLREAGFGPARRWSDERDWFAVYYAPAGDAAGA